MRLPTHWIFSFRLGGLEGQVVRALNGWSQRKYPFVQTHVFVAFIQWMAKTYGANPSLSECVNLTAYSCTPLFLAGFLGSFPILWLDMLLSLVAIAMSINLLYKGVPEVMNINQEKAFLFSSSILTVCMVSMVGMLAITIIFWGSGLSPIFVS